MANHSACTVFLLSIQDGDTSCQQAATMKGKKEKEKEKEKKKNEGKTTQRKRRNKKRREKR